MVVGKTFAKVSEKSETTVTGSSQIIELAKINVGETHQFALSNGMPIIWCIRDAKICRESERQVVRQHLKH